MEERAIHISSINREKRGTSRPGDFTIKFNPSLKLDPDKKHELALDRLSMTYSWYNIRSDYDNCDCSAAQSAVCCKSLAAAPDFSKRPPC